MTISIPSLALQSSVEISSMQNNLLELLTFRNPAHADHRSWFAPTRPALIPMACSRMTEEFWCNPVVTKKASFLFRVHID